jgi:hypothetical protein
MDSNFVTFSKLHFVLLAMLGSMKEFPTVFNVRSVVSLLDL